MTEPFFITKSNPFMPVLLIIMRGRFPVPLLVFVMPFCALSALVEVDLYDRKLFLRMAFPLDLARRDAILYGTHVEAEMAADAFIHVEFGPALFLIPVDRLMGAVIA